MVNDSQTNKSKPSSKNREGFVPGSNVRTENHPRAKAVLESFRSLKD